MNKTDALHQGLLKMLNYLPMIYNQQQISTVNTGEIIIKYPYEKIPDNALLFVLPLYSSLSSGNKLTIKYATVTSSGDVSYTVSKQYNIMVEGTDGKKRKAGLGDIVANRLCMFRFITGNSSDIILCNNPIYTNLSCSTLCITNEATFYQVPTVVYTANGSEKKTTLALNQDLQSLAERVTALENKIKIGTDTPEKYFEANPSAPKGTIYMQVEE